MADMPRDGLPAVEIVDRREALPLIYSTTMFTSLSGTWTILTTFLPAI